MNRGQLRPPLRWGLGGTVMLALAAIAWPDDPASTVIPPREPEPRGADARGPSTQIPQLPDRLAPQALAATTDFDPFVGLKARPPNAPVHIVEAVPPPVAFAPPSPQAPPVAYRYLGRFADPSGSTRVYLARGDEVVALTVGMVLPNGYTVQAIDDAAVKLRYPAPEVTTVLSIPSGSSIGVP